MRERIWFELTQAKHDHTSATFLLAQRRNHIMWFNIVVLLFSSGGIMGWKIWEYCPVISCIIITMIQLLRLIQPHILPTEKNIEKLEEVIDFYFDYSNEIEKLWLDHFNHRIDDKFAQDKFYELKEKEKAINKKTNEIVKDVSMRIKKKTDKEVRQYFKNNFQTE
jgi:hypothetical protein